MNAVALWAEKEFNFPAEKTFNELQEMFERGVRGDTFNQWLAEKYLNVEALVPKMIAAYRTHEPRIQPYPGTRELLERICREYALGIISDGYLDVQSRKWNALQLHDYFQVVIFSDVWGREAWKPSSRSFEEAIKQLKFPAAEMMYVADNPTKDFCGARAVGMGTVRIRRADGLYRHLEPLTPADAPDAEIAELQDLLKWFNIDSSICI